MVLYVLDSDQLLGPPPLHSSPLSGLLYEEHSKLLVFKYLLLCRQVYRLNWDQKFVRTKKDERAFCSKLCLVYVLRPLKENHFLPLHNSN
jgi:hypothetical protein